MAEVENTFASAPSAPALDPQLVEDLLAERDSQIAELRLAVEDLTRAGELARTQPEDDGEAQALRTRLAELEERLAEQEHAVRHTLTTLIEMIEAETSQSMAA